MALCEICKTKNKIDRFSIDIFVYKGNDKLGGGDLDNYCKAILDGITSTKKIWKDDKQVDNINISRYYRNEELSSSIEITITKLKNK